MVSCEHKENLINLHKNLYFYTFEFRIRPVERNSFAITRDCILYNVSCEQIQSLEMSGDRPLAHYNTLMQLTPETTNEELRKLYSAWHHDYDKVSVGSNAVSITTFVRLGMFQGRLIYKKILDDSWTSRKNVNIEEQCFGCNSFIACMNFLDFYQIFLGFTMQICSKSEWGSTSTVLMFMLYWREQMIGNCTYLLRNTRPTHTVP